MSPLTEKMLPGIYRAINSFLNNTAIPPHRCPVSVRPVVQLRPAPPATIVVDNTDPDFYTNGVWLADSLPNGAAFIGVNFLNLVYLNPPPLAGTIDNTSPSFSTAGAWF